MSIGGGKPPYHIYIDWEDSTHSELSFPVDSTFQIHHTYKKSGSYAIVVRSVDSTGNNRTLQLLALITDKYGNLPFANNLSDNGNPPDSKPNGTTSQQHYGWFEAIKSRAKWLLLAWPSYVIVTLMAASFWLGERREIDLITRRPRTRHHTRPKPKHA